MTLVGGPRRCSIPISGAKLLKTGQTTSYATGDDGELQEGREVDFFTLASNNPFGNTNRFTDELGGSTYANDIVIDWSTYDGTEVLGYYRAFVSLGTTPWLSALSNSSGLSVGSYSSGWRLANRREGFNLVNDDFNAISVLNYAPFNISTAILIWLSTTRCDGAAAAIILYTLYGQTIVTQNKSFSHYYLPVRNFTVTGTTLT